MLNQLRAVASTYVTRKANWALLALGLGVLWLTSFFGQTPEFVSVAPRQPSYWASATFNENMHAAGIKPLEEDEEKWDWSQVDQKIDLARFYTGPAIPWDELKTLPNLRQLDLDLRFGNSNEPNDFQRVAELPNLTYLSLPDKETISPDATESWNSLTQLEWLTIGKCKIEVESLPIFPKLHTLDMRLNQLSEESLDYLGRLPSLQILVLRDESNPAGGVTDRGEPLESPESNDPAIAGHVKDLAQLKNLETVYLPGREYGSLESIAKAALPSIAVHPLSVNAKIFTTMIFALLGSIVLSVVPGMAMYGQFTRAESVLTPGYQKPHNYVALASILVCGLLGVLAAVSSGVHWLGAAAAIALALGLTTTIMAINPPLWQRILLIVVCSFGFPLTSNSRILQIGLRRLFIGEDVLWVQLAMIAAGIALFANWAYRSAEFHRLLAEKGVSFPLLTFQDHSLAGQVLGALRVQQKGWPWMWKWLRPSDQQLDSVEFHQQQPRQRQTLLSLAGNNKAHLRMAGALILIYTGGLIVQSIYFPDKAGSELLHIFGCWYMLTLAMIPVTLWASRRQAFAYELCHPLTRRDFIDDLFSVRFRESTLLPIGLICVATIFALFTRSTVPSALAWSAGMALWILGVAAVYYGASMLALSLSRTWTIVAVGICCIVPMLAGTGAILYFSSKTGGPPKQIAPVAMMIVGTVLLAIGGALVSLAKMLWSQLEFAAFDSSSA